MLSLLFAADKTFLGSIITEGGGLSNYDLTPVGHGVLGERFRDWQTHGVRVRQHALEQTDDEQTCRFFYAQVPVHSINFQAAVSDWGHGHHLHLLSLTPDVLPYWDQLRRWPLSSDELFELIFALKQAAPADRKSFDKLLQHTERRFGQTNRSATTVNS